MGILLSCRDLSKAYSPRPLFEGLSFGLNDGERTGLIGPNGTGKSTLLRILAGLDAPDSGQVIARRGLRIEYAAQQDRFEDAGARTVRAELSEALQGLGLEDYEVDIRVEGGLERAGFGDPDRPVAALSGGWRKRLKLLAAVLREPDLLLLDEPTNHLDLEGVLWLEDLLAGVERSFLVVTHDRRFLERVTNRVIELNKRYPQGYFSAPGNYSRFLELREEYFAAQESRAESVRNLVRGEIEWLRKGPKARTTKQQARIDRAGELIGELAELDFRNAQTRAADIDFTGSERQTRRLVELQGAQMSLGGRKLFGPLDLRLGPGDKLGLLGENGSGKSTLLRILAGALAPDAGVVKRAERLQVVTFDQHREQLDMKMPLRRALVGGSGDKVLYRGNWIHVGGWADRFLFRGDQLDKPLSMLSGGEQSRVLIARLMLREADLLLLDEPTNDLDVQSLEVLEASLEDFPGALVLVTHDRWLLDRVCGSLLALDGKGGARYFADLSQWEDRRREETPGRPRRPSAPRPASSALSPKEQRELKNMETAIRSAEEKAAEAVRALEDPAIGTDAAELMKRQAAVEAAKARVDALYKRWEELEAR